MINKNIFVLIVCILSIFTSSQTVQANHIGAFEECTPNDPTASSHCGERNTGYSCQASKSDPKTISCQPSQPAQPGQTPSAIQDIFGKIQPPQAIKDFIGTDQTGAGGISKFLSNLIVLIYSIATVALVFMILWGAFDWLSSGGDKEKIESARRKIMSAIIGIILFATAFAVITVLGQFTGFKFFTGQSIKVLRDSSGNIIQVTCPNGTTINGTSLDLSTVCKNYGG